MVFLLLNCINEKTYCSMNWPPSGRLMADERLFSKWRYFVRLWFRFSFVQLLSHFWSHTSTKMKSRNIQKDRRILVLKKEQVVFGLVTSPCWNGQLSHSSNWPAHHRDGADYHRCRKIHNQRENASVKYIVFRRRNTDWLCYTFSRRKSIFLHSTRALFDSITIETSFCFAALPVCLFFYCVSSVSFIRSTDRSVVYADSLAQCLYTW